MKNYLLHPFFALIIAVVAMSCSDDSEDPGPEISAPAGKIVAKIAGTSFEATGGAQLYNNEIQLGGNAGSESLSILITKSAKIGTYDAKGAKLALTTPDAQVNYLSGSTLSSSSFATDGEKVGTVTITEIDETNKTISGTFSSKVYAENGTSKEIASGSFNKLPYTTAPQNTLSAKIDAAAFTASVAVGLTSSGVIALNGQSLNGAKIITISFPSDVAVGQYPFEDLIGDVYGTYTESGKIFISESGTLKITKHDKAAKRVEGSFSFNAVPFDEGDQEHALTEGAFAITYHN